MVFVYHVDIASSINHHTGGMGSWQDHPIHVPLSIPLSEEISGTIKLLEVRSVVHIDITRCIERDATRVFENPVAVVVWPPCIERIAGIIKYPDTTITPVRHKDITGAIDGDTGYLPGLLIVWAVCSPPHEDLAGTIKLQDVRPIVYIDLPGVSTAMLSTLQASLLPMLCSSHFARKFPSLSNF